MGARNLKSDEATSGADDLLNDISAVIKSRSGIKIEEKQVLIRSRVHTRMAALGIENMAEYYNLLTSSESELQDLLEMVTTHMTSWFREIEHFKWLKSELPKILNKERRINIWSAACSKGHEVYSLLFLLLKEGLKSEQIRILGTDISHAILNTATTLPQTEEFATQYEKLKRSMGSRGEFLDMELNNCLEKSIKFRIHNLISGPIESNVKFDVVFLRNVLIYFDASTIDRVCRYLCKNLKPGGFFVTGHCETLSAELTDLEPVQASVYRYNPRRVKVA